jgi:hypothetical protein
MARTIDHNFVPAGQALQQITTLGRLKRDWMLRLRIARQRVVIAPAVVRLVHFLIGSIFKAVI